MLTYPYNKGNVNNYFSYQRITNSSVWHRQCQYDILALLISHTDGLHKIDCGHITCDISAVVISHAWRSNSSMWHTLYVTDAPQQLHHNERCGVWNHWRLYCLLPFVQAQIKENIKATRHWLLRGDSNYDRCIPSQRASNAENFSIWWRHHARVI